MLPSKCVVDFKYNFFVGLMVYLGIVVLALVLKPKVPKPVLGLGYTVVGIGLHLVVD